MSTINAAAIEKQLDDLLLPVAGKVGATQKVAKLVDELRHPNIDWKFVVTNIRAYLFDYLYDLLPYQERVLPILFYFLKEAITRKKNSSLRAADTFFDRYGYIINLLVNGKEEFLPVKERFAVAADEFIGHLITDSNENFYFENMYPRIAGLARILSANGEEQGTLMARLAEFCLSQYRVYVSRNILIREEEIREIRGSAGDSEQWEQLIELMESITGKAYDEKIRHLEYLRTRGARAFFTEGEEILDFSFNFRVWEKICMIVKSSIENHIIESDESVLRVVGYLVQKSNQGDDRDLQLAISRIVSSVCSVYAESGRFVLLKGIIDLVMPVLLEEIERGRNYYAAFASIYNIGKTVIESNNISVIDHFEDILVRSRFCFPEFSGIASDWSVIINSSHLENIRTWMKLIELKPFVMKKLSASLIVNLKLGGVFLKDTDVFQRDISELLNSDYRGVFYLITSLAAVFPAFYHDIGATGDIRAFTEKIDTNHQMDDLVHFLRKQVHVESSSRTVYLIQRVMEFWMTGEKIHLQGMVPQEVYDRLDHIYRFINFDLERPASIIYETARTYFKEQREERFWDFLLAVHKDTFLEYVTSNNFDGVGKIEKEEALGFFTEFYKSQVPTEMTKILLYIRNMAGIDGIETKIWKFLYEISDDDFRRIFVVVSKCDVSHVNVEKFIIFLHVYRMLMDKYNFSDVRTMEKLELYAGENLFTPPDNFFEIIKSNDTYDALETLLDEQNHLKNEILLSTQVFPPHDTIEFKRHIAFGIPSMYGFYKEKKFDTLKVFFHMNYIRVRFFEQIIESLGDLSGEMEYDRIKQILKMFYKTFLIDGLANQEMINIFNLLETPNMKISQFRDVIHHLFLIHGEIADRFNATFRYVCKEAINNIGIDRISRQFIPRDNPENIEVIIDRFLRNQIMQSPLLQLFDNFLIKLRDRISFELIWRGDEPCLNFRATGLGTSVYEVVRLPDDPQDPYDPFDPFEEDESDYAAIHTIQKLARAPEEGKTFAPVWEIGSKAHGILFLANLGGVNAPPGLVLSSELYKRLEDDVMNNPVSKKQMIYLLKRYINIFAGNRFGNPKNPCLLSVRSGAVFSMPGIMDTITNVGLTMPVIEAYARKMNPWFAYDCYRRFIQDLATSYYGMDRRIFENLMYVSKKEAGVDLKEKLDGEQMKTIAMRYRKVVEDHGCYIPDDPYEQLLYSIIAVYRSWDAEVAKKYREFVNISGEWGTAVIIQNMVFGNIHPSDITGVVHSHYAGNEYISLFGEYKTRAQGHDVVSGVARVFPISEDQRRVYKKSSQYESLEKTNPRLYKLIFDTVKRVSDRWGNDIEMEFTVENGELYILQIRGMVNTVFETEELVEGPDALRPSLLGQGLAASGGAVSGRAVFNIDRIDVVRAHYPEDKIIIVRPETNPEDVVGIQRSDGVLTCLGGMTSHAVLQMRRLGKSGVSDFSPMRINDREESATVMSELLKEKTCQINEGDFITIDGSNGHVYRGYHQTRKKAL